MLPNLEDNPRPKAFLQKRKKASVFALAFDVCGETGIRTRATVARRQISNLLRYHSGTSPAPMRWFPLKRRQSYDKALSKQEKCVSSNSEQI